VKDPRQKLPIGVTCRAELKAEISSVNNDINAAIKDKEFAKASSLQSKLDDLEKLPCFLPYIEGA
jgi:hypothetical protein